MASRSSRKDASSLSVYFNKYHDKLGRFASAPGGSAGKVINGRGKFGDDPYDVRKNGPAIIGANEKLTIHLQDNGPDPLRLTPDTIDVDTGTITSGGKPFTLPRYGVWKYDRSRDKSEVIEVSDDRRHLIMKYGIKLYRHAEYLRPKSPTDHGLTDYFNKYHDRLGRFASAPGGAPLADRKQSLWGKIKEGWKANRRSVKEANFLRNNWFRDVDQYGNFLPPIEFKNKEWYQLRKRKYGADHVYDIKLGGEWAYHKRLPDGKIWRKASGKNIESLKAHARENGLTSRVPAWPYAFSAAVATKIGVSYLANIDYTRKVLIAKYGAWRKEHQPPDWPWRGWAVRRSAAKHGVRPPVEPWPSPKPPSRQIPATFAEQKDPPASEFGAADPSDVLDDVPEILTGDEDVDAAVIPEEELDGFFEFLSSLTEDDIEKMFEEEAVVQ